MLFVSLPRFRARFFLLVAEAAALESSPVRGPKGMSTKIGRFEIVTELTKSGSGAVYKANDPDGGRTVALKTIRLDLPPDLAQILIQLILREAESTKVLNSQNIALLY